MSKASRMFRSRTNRGVNLATLPVADPDPLRPAEADPSACLAALYGSSHAAFLDESYTAMIPDAPFADPADAPAGDGPLLSFDAKAAGEGSDSTDVLAILLQTIDANAQNQNFVAAAVVVAESFPHESAILAVSASESHRAELFIVEKPVAIVRPAAPIHTEVMDLETIAASARESGHATSGDDSSCAQSEDPSACEAAKEQAVAEMRAVAEDFVAEQRHHTSPKSGTSAHERPQDRRQKRRALISAPIRVRTTDQDSSEIQEIATTFDVSRSGILFHTQLDFYARGMSVAVVFPYNKSPKAVHTEQQGRVVRVSDLGDGVFGVALTFPPAAAEEAAPAAAQEQAPAAQAADAPAKKPLVLAVEADAQMRDGLKMYLENEGYDVIAVGNPTDAREVLGLFTPSLVIAEVEGEGDNRPGYDLCDHIKTTPRLRRVPVVLTTFSAYPSDYSQAHALGAIVCMAKPYKQERLGHIVRLLAPLPEHIEKTAAPHAADPTRVPGRDFSTRNNHRERKVGGAIKLFGKVLFKFPALRKA
jgi:CheY-like chemotaxis protein